MRWFLRSALAAAGLGAVGSLALSQPDDPPAPPVTPVASAPALPEVPLPPSPAAPLAPLPVPPEPAPLPAPPAAPLLPQPREPVVAELPALPPPPPPTVTELPPIPDAPAEPPMEPPAEPASASTSSGSPEPESRPTVLPDPSPCFNGRCALPPDEPFVFKVPLPGAMVAAPTAPTVPPPAAPAGLCDAVYDPAWRCLPQRQRFSARGWLNGGYVYNTSVPDSKFNGPYNSIDRSAEPMFNQGYLILERGLPTDGSFGWGARVDTLFGYDHLLAQSRGLEVDRDFGRRWNGEYYGLAIPQAYVEGGNDRLSLKLGHFYTTVGYEVLPAIGNFFYSRAYSYQFGQPINHWGGVLTARLSDNWQAHAGLVNGWNTLVGRVNEVNFLGGLRYTPDSQNWWTSFAIVTGEQQNNLGLPFLAPDPGNRTRYSFLIGLTPGGPCGRWEYVFHNYYGWQENGTLQGNFARWYGIDQYLYYRVTDRAKLGTRFEWFRDEDGTRVGLNRLSNPNNPPLPGNYWSWTFGLNYAPVPNFLVRPEFRWDFTSDTVRRAFNDGAKNNQYLLALDLIWQF